MKGALLLALALAAPPAHAVNVAGQAPAAGLKAWGPAVTSSFVNAGGSYMFRLSGSHPSLFGLSHELYHDTLRAQTELPPSFARLVRALEAKHQHAEAWFGKPLHERLEDLKKAEASAVDGAIADVDAALKAAPTPESMTYEQAQALAARVEQLRADTAHYLPKGPHERLWLVSKRIRELQEERRLAVLEWMTRTAGKMARGDFDNGAPLFRYDSATAQVRIADASPDEPGFATFEQAVLARVAEADAMPAGPWKTSMYQAVLVALMLENERPGRQMQTPPYGEAEAQRRAASKMLPLLIEQVRERRDRSLEQSKAVADARAALRRYKKRGGMPPMKHVEAMTKLYDEAARSALGGDPRRLWRVGAAYESGSGSAEGYLSRQELSEAADDAYARWGRRKSAHWTGYFVALLGTAAAFFGTETAANAVFGLAMVAMGLYAGFYALYAGERQGRVENRFAGEAAGKAADEARGSLESLKG